MNNLNHGGETDSDSDLSVLPSLRDDTSSAPRMLTPSEIEWLKRHQKAVFKELQKIAETASLA